MEEKNKLNFFSPPAFLFLRYELYLILNPYKNHFPIHHPHISRTHLEHRTATLCSVSPVEHLRDCANVDVQMSQPSDIALLHLWYVALLHLRCIALLHLWYVALRSTLHYFMQLICLVLTEQLSKLFQNQLLILIVELNLLL